MRNYLLTAFVGLFLCACNSENIIEQTKKEANESKETVSAEIMSFDSKDDFRKALEEYDATNGTVTRTSSSFQSADKAYNNSSEGDSTAEQIGFLVPDEKYRRFLNKDLEIIVKDTLYRVTKHGTFFAHVSCKKELENAIDKVEKFTRITGNLKRLGNVKLKDTFGTWSNNTSNPIEDDNYFDRNDNDIVLPNRPTTRSTNRNELTREEVERFPVVGAVKVHIAHKILNFSPHYLKHSKFRFNSNPHRKLYVSLYRYDYVFGVSIGIDCKVMKKLWHGLSWGRMKNWDDGIYYGISALIVKSKIKEPVFNDLMNFGKAKLKEQWQSLNNHKFTTYAESIKNFQGGIENRWHTEYNGNPTKNPYAIPIIGESVNNVLGDNNASRWIAKQLDSFLKSKGISYFTNLNTDSSGKEIQFFSENDKSIYSLFSNDITWNGGGYRLHNTFLKYYRSLVFGVNINFGGSKSNLKVKPNVNISENEMLGVPEIYFCEGIVYTRDGNGWIGARIIQEPSDNSFVARDRGVHFGGRR